MKPSIIQSQPETMPEKPPSQAYPSTVYISCLGLVGVAVELLFLFAGRGPDGTFDSKTLVTRLHAMPRCAYVALIVHSLILFTAMFDCIGRMYAFRIARIGFAGSITQRRLATARFAVLSSLLALLVIVTVLIVFPDFYGWELVICFGPLAVPIALSIADWMRSPTTQLDDSRKI